MNQYTFASKTKTVLIAFMVLGVVCMGITWFVDDAYHTRFWSNFLHNSVFYTGIALMAPFFLSICLLAYAGWHTVFKRVWEAFTSFLIPGLVLMIIVGLGVYFHAHHLYHWSDASALDPTNPHYDALLAGKSSFLNKNWYLFGTVIIGALWVFLATKMRDLSRAEDTDGDTEYTHYHSRKKYAAIFLPVAGFTSAALVWLWVMSVDAHWYSTLFAWYATSSWFVSMIAITILMLIYLKSKGYFSHVSDEHMHDLGKFLFAFSIFWTYLWFSQYLLIWYSNVGEETIYFRERYDNYPVLFYGILVINFVVPFFVLIRNSTKRKVGTLVLVSVLVLIGHWLDFFLMLKPGILLTAKEALGHGDHGHGEAAHHAAEHVSVFVNGFTLPGLLEIGTFLGFTAFFMFVLFTALTKASLTPKNDPYLKESLHHHV